MDKPLQDLEQEFEDIELNKDFTLDECTFFSDDKAVIFSPFTTETLLCEKTVLDALGALAHCDRQKSINVFRDISPDFYNEVLTKLISMRIISLKK